MCVERYFCFSDSCADGRVYLLSHTSCLSAVLSQMLVPSHLPWEVLTSAPCPDNCVNKGLFKPSKLTWFWSKTIKKCWLTVGSKNSNDHLVFIMFLFLCLWWIHEGWWLDSCMIPCCWLALEQREHLTDSNQSASSFPVIWCTKQTKKYFWGKDVREQWQCLFLVAPEVS